MKKIPMSMLQSAEIAVLAEKILTIVAAFVSNIPVLKVITDRIESRLNLLNQALSRDFGSDYTQKLLDSDAARDNNFMFFRDFVNAFLRNPRQDVKESARSLISIIRKYGFSLQRYNYEKQTKNMDLLVAELKEPANLELIRKIGAEDHLLAMETSMLAFKELEKEKREEEAPENYPQTYQAFRQLAGDLKVFIFFLRKVNEENFSPELKKAMEEIEMELKQSIGKARARRGRAENDDSDDVDVDYDEMDMAG